MTPERAKELLPVITAFAEGKKIQSRCTSGGEWVDISTSTFCEECDYRIKPEPREWWLVQCLNGTHAFVAPPDQCESIHVREVLE